MIEPHLVGISDIMKTLSVLAFVFALLCGANFVCEAADGSSVDAVTNLDAFDDE